MVVSINPFLFLPILLLTVPYSQQQQPDKFLYCSHYIGDANFQLKLNKTLCLFDSNNSRIYAVTLRNVKKIWGISNLIPSVLSKIEPKNCFCDCGGNEGACATERLQRTCPGCPSVVKHLPSSRGCRDGKGTVGCCTYEITPLKNIRTMELRHPSIFYSIDLSIWSDHNGQRVHEKTELYEELNGRHDQRPFKSLGSQLELHSLSIFSEKENVIVEDTTQLAIPRLPEHHRCVDAVSRTQPLSVSRRECLPDFYFEDCLGNVNATSLTWQSTNFTASKHLHLDHGERHATEYSNNVTVGLHAYDTGPTQRFTKLVDTSTLGHFDHGKIVLDQYSRRYLSVTLYKASGVLELTVKDLQTGQSYHSHLNLPSTFSQSLVHSLPPWINGESDVCLETPDSQTNRHKYCMVVPYTNQAMMMRSDTTNSIITPICAECYSGVFGTIAHLAQVLFPLQSVSKLVSGEPLGYADYQQLVIIFISFFLFFLCVYIGRKCILPIIECLCCLCTVFPTRFFSRRGDREQEEKRDQRRCWRKEYHQVAVEGSPTKLIGTAV